MSTQDSIPLRVIQGSLQAGSAVLQWVGRTGPDDDNVELINYLPHVEVPDPVLGVGCSFFHSSISGSAQPGDPVQIGFPPVTGGDQQLFIPVGENEPSANDVRQWMGSFGIASGETQAGIPIPANRDLWIQANAPFSAVASGFDGSYVLRRGVT